MVAASLVSDLIQILAQTARNRWHVPCSSIGWEVPLGRRMNNLVLVAMLTLVVAACGKGKRIELTDEEMEIGEVQQGAILRDKRGKLLLVRDQRALARYAEMNGLNVTAVEDALKTATENGGVMSAVARGSKQTQGERVVQAIKDMLAHQKVKMNENDGDLDLVFGLDYSGSMSDDIEHVVKGLQEIVSSLDNVFQAGRSIRIGLMTFGDLDKERIDLDFTGDTDAVKAMLQQLLDKYNGESHSTNPGEANFRGLRLAAKSMTWQSQNRMVLQITDEGSYELQTNETSVIEEAKAAAKQAGLNIATYTIVTPQN